MLAPVGVTDNLHFLVYCCFYKGLARENSVLDQVSIVLVNTSHPGNIGAAARAMKNMGLSRLVLVSPKEFPHAEATARAAGADDLLCRAQVADTLEEAIADAHFVVGTSARQRNIPWPLAQPRECADKIKPLLTEGSRVAFVFGNEQSGLSNEELAQCHYHLNIPCDENFSSLNLAAAVQIVCYELRMMLQHLTENTAEKPVELEVNLDEQTRVSAKEMESFYTGFETLLVKVGYLQLSNPGKLMLRLRRLFNRAIVEKNEIHILRGIFRAIDQRLGEKD